MKLIQAPSCALWFAILVAGCASATSPPSDDSAISKCRGKHCKTPDMSDSTSPTDQASPTDLSSVITDAASVITDAATTLADMAAVDQATGSTASSPMIAGCPMFPSDNAWNKDISALPVHPSSAAYIASIGATAPLKGDFTSPQFGGPEGYGIPFTIVPGSQPKVPISFYRYPADSDAGPYPIPNDIPIERPNDPDSDRHGLVLETGTCTLYETLGLRKNATSGQWEASVGAIWKTNVNWTRPQGLSSADAAGLPIIPGLVRYDEVQAGEIKHALRFTVRSTQKAYIAPASHYASSSTDPSLPPMGLRVRLKASKDISGFPPHTQVILRALKKYGMLLADNGGTWYVSGQNDARWDDAQIGRLRDILGSDLEAVDTGPLIH
jgi:hypothetical protein